MVVNLVAKNYENYKCVYWPNTIRKKGKANKGKLKNTDYKKKKMKLVWPNLIKIKRYKCLPVTFLELPFSCTFPM